ncbi:MAG TPA: DUF2795 domain-containing protein [Stellaceae bacterium]|nr:DUF2795 domain-containing protein [Stellaceae bacterium]
MSSLAMSSPAIAAEAPATARRDAGFGRARISWGAVIAGVVVALASGTLLGLIGVALGISGVQPGAAATGIGTGVWAVISTVVAMALGGYIAARLCGTYSHLDSELHGLTVWALTLLLGVALLAELVSGVIGVAVEGAGAATGGALSGAGGLASGITQQISPQAMIGQLEDSLTSGGDPTQMTKEGVRNEIAMLVGRRVYTGSLSDRDRDRLALLVSTETGISKDAAAQRIAGLEQRAQEFQTQAQQRLQDATAAATRAAAVGTRALSAGLILGLATALIGAWFGTRHAQVLAPAYRGDTPTTVDYAYAGQHPRPAQERVIIHGDATQRIIQHLHGLTFPASKRDLLGAAKTGNFEPGLAAAFEHIPDRQYYDINDVLTALGMAS